jgi:hypothetical protein
MLDNPTQLFIRPENLARPPQPYWLPRYRRHPLLPMGTLPRTHQHLLNRHPRPYSPSSPTSRLTHSITAAPSLVNDSTIPREDTPTPRHPQQLYPHHHMATLTLRLTAPHSRLRHMDIFPTPQPYPRLTSPKLCPSHRLQLLPSFPPIPFTS